MSETQNFDALNCCESYEIQMTWKLILTSDSNFELMRSKTEQKIMEAETGMKDEDGDLDERGCVLSPLQGP